MSTFLYLAVKVSCSFRFFFFILFERDVALFAE